MPLILAIEPDRRQAAYLTSLVRRSVGAELILVDTTERALDAIGSQVPDLVLVPALLSPHDDAALATALRVIASAAHVQMLTIPVLGAQRPSQKPAGVLQGLRRDRSRGAEPDGCDPTVFAEQIASYLERAAAERASLLADALPDVTALPVDATPPEETAVLAAASVVDGSAQAPAVDDAPVAAVPFEEAAGVEPPLPDPVAVQVWNAVDDAPPFAAVPFEEAAGVEPPLPDPVAVQVWNAVDDAAPVAAVAFEEAAGVEPPLPDPVAVQVWNAVDDAAPVAAVAFEEAAGVQPPLPDAVAAQLWSAVEDAVRSQFLTAMPDAPPLADSTPALADGIPIPTEEIPVPAEEVTGRDEVLQATVLETGGLDAGDTDVPVAETIAVAAEPRPDVIDERVWMAIEEAFLTEFSSVTPGEPVPGNVDLTAEVEDFGSDGQESGRAALAAEPEDDDITTFVLEPIDATTPAETVLPAKGEREWVELIASLRHDVERLRLERSKPVPQPAAPRPARFTRTGKPGENEWGLFDPEQCGFAALLAKLDEVTESDETLRA